MMLIKMIESNRNSKLIGSAVVNLEHIRPIQALGTFSVLTPGGTLKLSVPELLAYQFQLERLSY